MSGGGATHSVCDHLLEPLINCETSFLVHVSVCQHSACGARGGSAGHEFLTQVYDKAHKRVFTHGTPRPPAAVGATLGESMSSLRWNFQPKSSELSLQILYRNYPRLLSKLERLTECSSFRVRSSPCTPTITQPHALHFPAPTELQRRTHSSLMMTVVAASGVTGQP
jgi:hypothetical protein